MVVVRASVIVVGASVFVVVAGAMVIVVVVGEGGLVGGVSLQGLRCHCRCSISSISGFCS